MRSVTVRRPHRRRARTPVSALPCAWPRARTSRELAPCSTTVRMTACTSWPREEVTAVLDGRTQWATAAFEVADRTHVPVPGDPAPRTDNPLLGDPDVPPTAIDSRAGDNGSVPDPELHSTHGGGRHRRGATGHGRRVDARVLRQPVLRADHRRGAVADPALRRPHGLRPHRAVARLRSAGD